MSVSIIICSIGGAVLGILIGYRSGKKAFEKRAEESKKPREINKKE